MIGYRPSSWLRMVAWMSIPTGLLMFLSPARAIRRMERRAAWNVARQVREAISDGAQRPAMPPISAGPSPALRPIRDAMPADQIDGVQKWARAAQPLFPAPAHLVLEGIDQNRPVGEVRDDARELLDDIHAKQAELQ